MAPSTILPFGSLRFENLLRRTGPRDPAFDVRSARFPRTNGRLTFAFINQKGDRYAIPQS